jgi:hypothetical protein
VSGLTHCSELKAVIYLFFAREGTNALDAAFLAYANVSVLRQQIKPDHRVHGIVEGKDWSPNGGMRYTGAICL